MRSRSVESLTQTLWNPHSDLVEPKGSDLRNAWQKWVVTAPGLTAVWPLTMQEGVSIMPPRKVAWTCPTSHIERRGRNGGTVR